MPIDPNDHVNPELHKQTIESLEKLEKALELYVENSPNIDLEWLKQQYSLLTFARYYKSPIFDKTLEFFQIKSVELLNMLYDGSFVYKMKNIYEFLQLYPTIKDWLTNNNKIIPLNHRDFLNWFYQEYPQKEILLTTPPTVTRSDFIKFHEHQERILLGNHATNPTQAHEQNFFLSIGKILVLYDTLNFHGRIWQPMNFSAFLNCFDLNYPNPQFPVFNDRTAFIMLLAKIGPHNGGKKVDNNIAKSRFNINNYRQAVSRGSDSATRTLAYYRAALNDVFGYPEESK